MREEISTCQIRIGIKFEPCDKSLPAFFPSNIRRQTVILNATIVTFLVDRRGIVAHVVKIVEEIIVVRKADFSVKLVVKPKVFWLPSVHPGGNAQNLVAFWCFGWTNWSTTYHTAAAGTTEIGRK